MVGRRDASPIDDPCGVAPSSNCVLCNTRHHFNTHPDSDSLSMATPLRQYIDSMSTFDELETRLISFSPMSVRSSSDDVRELVESIREHGMLEPIIVRPRANDFEVVAGNRRLRASKLLKHRKVKCIVTDIDDASSYEVSLVENMHRKTLSPLEEATAFKTYCTTWGWGSQSRLAKRIGRSQEYISHRMKLLDLSENAKQALTSGKISPSAALELSWIKDGEAAETALEMLETGSQNTKEVRSLGRATKVAGRTTEYDSRNPASEGADPESKLLKESILILRISLVRLDSVIAKVKSPEMKKSLLSKRVVLHQMVDDLMQAKDSAYEKRSEPAGLLFSRDPSF